VDWRSRASQIVDFIDFEIERKTYVVPDDFEMRIADKIGNITLAACKEVIYAYNLVTTSQQPGTKMRS
jgi:hypothetical protein